jgi:hypothetical protein
MKQVFNKLLNLRKIGGGGAEMFYRGGFPGLSIDVDPDYVDWDLDKEEVREELARYQDGLQRWLLLKGLKVSSIKVTISDPTPHRRCELEDICITIGIPMRVFMGSERGELASSQDQRSWNQPGAVWVPATGS